MKKLDPRYKEAEKWIKDQFIPNKERKLNEIETGSNENLYFTFTGSIGNLIERFLIIFPDFRLWNVGLDETGKYCNIVFTLKKSGMGEQYNK